MKTDKLLRALTQGSQKAQGRLLPLPKHQGIDKSQTKKDPYKDAKKELYQLEMNLNKHLGWPHQKASDFSVEGTDPWGDRFSDSKRHAAGAFYTNKGIQNLFPDWAKYTGFPQLAGFLGSNALGIGHELGNWDSKTSGQDIYNNLIGAAIGSIADKKSGRELIKNLAEKEILMPGYIPEPFEVPAIRNPNNPNEIIPFEQLPEIIITPQGGRLAEEPNRGTLNTVLLPGPRVVGNKRAGGPLPMAKRGELPKHQDFGPVGPDVMQIIPPAGYTGPTGLVDDRDVPGGIFYKELPEVEITTTRSTDPPLDFNTWLADLPGAEFLQGYSKKDILANPGNAERWQKAQNTHYINKLFKKNPGLKTLLRENRLAGFKQLEPSDLEALQNSDYAYLTEPGLGSMTLQGLASMSPQNIGLSLATGRGPFGTPMSVAPGLTPEEARDYNNPLAALSVFGIPSRLVQAGADQLLGTGEYGFSDAIRGRSNPSGGIQADLMADPFMLTTGLAKGAQALNLMSKVKVLNKLNKLRKLPDSPNAIDYMSLDAPKGNMYGENQTLVQLSRLLHPKTKEKFFKHQAPLVEPTIGRDFLGDRVWKAPKDYGNRITPENYDDFVTKIHSSTGYAPAAEYTKRPGNLGLGNYGWEGVVFSDAPLNNLGKDIINAHEKSHGLFVGTMSKQMNDDLLRPFGTTKPIKGYRGRDQADEVLSRMAQFKNAVGMGDDQVFTLGHLNLIRKNYANRFLDNNITELLDKIKPGSWGEREFLKNMNKYGFSLGVSTMLGTGALKAASNTGELEENKKGGPLPMHQGLAASEVENTQIPQEYLNDPYIGMRKYYDDAYAALDKYKNEQGEISPFNMARAWTKASLKNPGLLFRERRRLPLDWKEIESVEGNPYHKQSPIIRYDQNTTLKQWPTDMVTPKRKDYERYIKHIEKQKKKEEPVVSTPEPIISTPEVTPPVMDEEYVPQPVPTEIPQVQTPSVREDMPYITSNKAFDTNYVGQDNSKQQSGSYGSGTFYKYYPKGKNTDKPVFITADQYDAYKKQGILEGQPEKRIGGPTTDKLLRVLKTGLPANKYGGAKKTVRVRIKKPK